MLSAKEIQDLKRTNTSIDRSLTRERVKELWKSAASNEKQEILTLSGLKSPTIYRVYQQGTISPAIAISMAQVMNISPQFLTGESDERGECTSENIKSYSKKNRLVKRKQKTKRSYGNTPRTIVLSEEQQKQHAPHGSLGGIDQDNLLIPDLSDDNWEILFKSMLLKARANREARACLDKIKSMLLL